jgi:hypothetical protein
MRLLLFFAFIVEYTIASESLGKNSCWYSLFSFFTRSKRLEEEHKAEEENWFKWSQWAVFITLGLIVLVLAAMFVLVMYVYQIGGVQL